ncbi:MAG: hypothetical protein RR869_01025 [Lachnospiraceae bacterium]
MYEEVMAELKMENPILTGGTVDERVYPCKILTYDKGEEFIYLSLLQGELPHILLDAVYQCKLILEEEVILCDGMIKERYQNEEGKILILQVENGFYKINIK